MPAKGPTSFTVEGTYPFPVDMLRYDMCWPASGFRRCKYGNFAELASGTFRRQAPHSFDDECPESSHRWPVGILRMEGCLMTDQGDLLLSQFNVGDRVELHPATDAWMSGDRYGEVTKIGRFYLYVRMDRSKLLRRLTPDKIYGKV
jgi:hypothetical protein